MNVFLDGIETVFFPPEKWRFEPVSEGGCVEENSNSTKHFEKEIWMILSRWYMLTWELKNEIWWASFNVYVISFC